MFKGGREPLLEDLQSNLWLAFDELPEPRGPRVLPPTTTRAVRVTAIAHRRAESVVTVLTDSGPIQATPEHRFARAEGGWVQAASLVIGDQLRTSDKGRTATVLATKTTVGSSSVDVYSFTVDSGRESFVGEGSLLVCTTCSEV